MKAKDWLKQKGIHPTEPIYWDTGEKNIYLDELMDEFVSGKSCKNCISFEMTSEKRLKNFCTLYSITMSNLHSWDINNDYCGKFEGVRNGNNI